MIYWKYYLEIKNRLTLLLFFWSFYTIIAYTYKETFIFLFLIKPNELLYSNNISSYFIFTDIRELFSVYMKITLFISNQATILLLLFHFFVFFSSGLYYSEYLHLKRLIYFSLFFWVCAINFLNQFLLPFSLNFFLSFQTLSFVESIRIHFESKLVEYLDFYILFKDVKDQM